jgi:MFS family permease
MQLRSDDVPAGVRLKGLARPAPWRGWAVVVLGFLMAFMAAGPVFYSYGVFVPSFASEFHASRTLINLAMTMVLVLGGLVSAPVGWLTDRFPLRYLALVGVVGTAAGMVVCAQADSMTQIVCIYATLISTAEVLLGMLIINIMIASWFERRRGLAIGLAAIGSSVSAIAFPPFAAYLVGAYGWRMTFMVFAALTMMLAPLVLWLGRAPEGGIPEWERKTNRAAAPSNVASPAPSWVEYFGNADFWIIALGIGTLIALNGAVMSSLVAFGMGNGLDRMSATQLVSTAGSTAIVGKLSFGVIADRVNLKIVLRVGLIVGALAMGLFALAPERDLLIIEAGIYGFSLGTQLPVWGALTAQCFGLEHFGRALGATRAAMTPMLFFYPLIVAQSFDQTNDYRIGWGILCALTLIALFASFMRSRKQLHSA